MSFRFSAVAMKVTSKASGMKLPIRCRFCSYAPWLASFLCAVLCLLTSIAGSWIAQGHFLSLAAWIGNSIVAGIGGTAVATCLAWLLATRIRREHAALQKLNHELRNGLQIVQYVCSLAEPKLAGNAQLAIGRMMSAVAAASEQLHHRSAEWPKKSRKQAAA